MQQWSRVSRFAVTLPQEDGASSFRLSRFAFGVSRFASRVSRFAFSLQQDDSVPTPVTNSHQKQSPNSHETPSTPFVRASVRLCARDRTHALTHTLTHTHTHSHTHTQESLPSWMRHRIDGEQAQSPPLALLPHRTISWSVRVCLCVGVGGGGERGREGGREKQAPRF